jgi:hypothetical protein
MVGSDGRDRAQRRAGGLPPLLRFMAVHCATGIAIGWSLMLGLVWLDVSGLGTRLAASPDGGLAMTLLAVFFAITFGGAGIGIAVMNLPWEDRR